jgi:hypothetical protein
VRLHRERGDYEAQKDRRRSWHKCAEVVQNWSARRAYVLSFWLFAIDESYIECRQHWLDVLDPTKDRSPLHEYEVRLDLSGIMCRGLIP